MPARATDLDRLLDTLVAGLASFEERGWDGSAWVALAGPETPRRSPSRRFSERSGQAGVVVCRHPRQASELSTLRGADTVLQSTDPLPTLLADGQMPCPLLLFIETSEPPDSDLTLKLAQPPALVLAELPARGLRRQMARRRLRRRLGRAGYTLLAEGQREALFEHIDLPLSSNAWSRRDSVEPTPALRIHSFDFWDTLITRWHPDPKVVFDVVGAQAGIADFRALRVRAEREARRRHDNYSLNDIYSVLVSQGTLPAEKGEAIQELELAVEEEFAQPVQANLDRLHAGDVVISDMYLSADQMRRIARPYADLDRHPFLVSPCGKSSSSVWRQLKRAGIAARHLGDNYMADYVRAARRDHQVALVRECRYSPLEGKFHEEGLVALANLMRLQRLSTPLDQHRLGQPGNSLAGLVTVQRRFNLPLLYMVALELLRRSRGAKPPSHILFCSRDCGYLHGIYRAMVRACSTAMAGAEGMQQEGEHPVDHYYLTSRKAKDKASAGYRAYSRSLLGGGPTPPSVLLVDVQGSGRSSFTFFGRYLNLAVSQLFIYTNHGAKPVYSAEGLLPRHFVRRLLPRACDLLEVLNYSSDHSLLEMHELGGGRFIPAFEQENRPQRLLEICKAFETFFHHVKSLMNQRPFQYLFLEHDYRNFRTEHLQLLEQVDGLEDLRLLRELYLKHHRRH